MPEEVWTRLEAALAQEAAQMSGSTATTGVTVLASDPSKDGPPTAKLRRPVRPVHTTRRQQRQDHTGLWGTLTSGFGWGGLAAVAAGIIVVVGVGATVLHGLLPGDSNVAAGLIAKDEAQSETRLTAAGPRSVIVSTGTNYQPSKLESQVRDLVAAVRGETTTDKHEDNEVTDSSIRSSPLVRGPELPAGAWSRAELAACLKAIDAEDLAPVAVDFAKFDGREVALLVLPSPAQEYEVWAVSRSCTAGNDGTQFFQIVKP
jgi:hypothetical protein